jgi:hypothetical protein
MFFNKVKRKYTDTCNNTCTFFVSKSSVMQEPYGRVYNFSAGPAVLPLPVLEESQADLMNWKGSGISVMEMSHRGPEFSQIIAEAEADLRSLLSIPDNYKLLFLQGGASQQFAAIPLNLTQPGATVDHVCSRPAHDGHQLPGILLSRSSGLILLHHFTFFLVLTPHHFSSPCVMFPAKVQSQSG